MEKLKTLNLTEKDFDMIIDGLDVLPSKDLPGEMMIDLLKTSLLEGEERQQFMRERKAKSREKNFAKQQLVEDIKILQGKLLSLKRVLIENGIMKEAESSLTAK